MNEKNIFFKSKSKSALLISFSFFILLVYNNYNRIIITLNELYKKCYSELRCSATKSI